MKNIKHSFFLLLIFELFISITSYFYLINTRCYHIPILIGTADTPLAKITIEDKDLLVEIDSGSKFQLTLNRETLAQIKKEKCGTLQGRDPQGNIYNSPAYLVKKIKAGGRELSDVIVKEVNVEYVNKITLFVDENKIKEQKNKSCGTLGRGFLESMNFLLDCKNRKIIQTNNKKALEKAGYFLEYWLPVPFELGRTVAILNVDTDMGKIRLSIDTGSTLSMIRSSSLSGTIFKQEEYGLNYFNTNVFKISNKDFGTMNLYAIDLSEELYEIDGVLGMEFIKNHPIYIDYKEKIAYIR